MSGHYNRYNSNENVFEIFTELPKCDQEMWSDHMLLEKMAPILLVDSELSQSIQCKKCSISKLLYN
jgi:hypothetical protein